MLAYSQLVATLLLCRQVVAFLNRITPLVDIRSLSISEKGNDFTDFFDRTFGIKRTSEVGVGLPTKQEIVDEGKLIPLIDIVPNSGIIEYNGFTKPSDGSPRWSTDEFLFTPTSTSKLYSTRFNLWRQLPWKKIKGKVILKAKVGGAIPLEKEPQGISFGARPDFEVISSLEELVNLFNFGAHDPRIQAIFMDIDGIACGYAKLTEVRRIMAYFRSSGKQIIGYCSGGSEKELYLALGCDEFYVPPDGGLDLRGFSAAATFVRGVFDKIGIEPQVQRIGKYKSFGDTFNRTSISEAQREVISSLLMEASDFWADSVATALNKTSEEIIKIWSDTGIKTPYDYRDFGLITGVKYYDQVEELLKNRYKKEVKPGIMEKIATYFSPSVKNMASVAVEALQNESLAEIQDFELKREFTAYPRRNSTFLARKKEFEYALTRTTSGGKDDEEDRVIVEFGDPSKSSSGEIAEKTSSPLQGEEDASSSSALPPSSSTESVGEDGSNSRAIAMAALDTMATPVLNITDKMVVSKKKLIAFRNTYEKMKNMQKRKLESIQGRFLPGGIYLRKMRKGSRILTDLRLKEVRSGPRIGVINAVGGINTGRSNPGGLTGRSLGSDSLIELVRRAKEDPGIRAVVIRVDSPGGSALASDLMWREIRTLARKKPVVASMVDVAASGGYYISMACDEIVAEELTVTGSIGVVTSKFNLQELNRRIGYGVDTLSRGRYAEVLSSSRGFTDEEQAYFEEGAQKAYKSFITKAAASRSMSVDAMNEVAQGRVWTGRQALQRGLVDHMGGFVKALKVAYDMSDLPAQDRNKTLNYQVIQEFRGGFPFPLGGASATLFQGSGASSSVEALGSPLAICDDAVACTSLASTDALGVGSALTKIGLDPLVAYAVAHSPLRGLASTIAISMSAMNAPTAAMSAAVGGMKKEEGFSLSSMFTSLLEVAEDSFDFFT